MFGKLVLKKTIEQAHLDITHYESLSKEQEQDIENEANKIVLQGKSISKSYMNKKEAELEYGFRLYQGGVVPGNQLRVVKIEDTDVEACCGTHCDNTSEVGWIKLLRTTRVADGTVRLYYVAGEKTIARLNKETEILNKLQETWNVPLQQLPSTGLRFFKDYKKLNDEKTQKERKILGLQVKCVLSSNNIKNGLIISDQDDATLYFSFLGIYAKEIKETGKGVVFVGGNFIFGLLGDPSTLKVDDLKNLTKLDVKTKNDIKLTIPDSKEKIDVKGILQFSAIGAFDAKAVQEFFAANNFIKTDL